jgi:hypothetical protein
MGLTTGCESTFVKALAKEHTPEEMAEAQAANEARDRRRAYRKYLYGDD